MLFFSLAYVWFLLSVVEGAFHVKTEFVSVDFNDGAAAYDKIRPHLERKDIGILGQSPLSSLSVIVQLLR